MELLTTLNNKMMKILDYIIVILMASLLTIIFFQGINRFILHIPAAWTEEIGRYAFVWLSLFGSVKALKERVHLSVDILILNLKPSVKPYLEVITELLTLVFCLILTYTGFSYTVENIGLSCEFGQFPIAIFYAAVPVAGLLLSCVSIGQLAEQIKKVKKSNLKQV